MKYLTLFLLALNLIGVGYNALSIRTVQATIESIDASDSVYQGFVMEDLSMIKTRLGIQ